MFDELVVGIGINVEKEALFSPDERVELVGRTTAHLPNIRVMKFSGLAVHFVRQLGARVMVRGVRPLTDIASEFTMMLANRELDPEIETVFLMADQRFAHVSSSLIKQIAPLATDEMLERFVPPSLVGPLRDRLSRASRVGQGGASDV